jgi:hypothetical protein
MNSQQPKGPDAARSYLRSVVEAVDYDISHLDQAATGEPCGTIDQLKEHWKELVSLLALGLEPEYRECPSCRRTGMRFATKCGFCWVKLPPFIPPPEEPNEKLE